MKSMTVTLMSPVRDAADRLIQQLQDRLHPMLHIVQLTPYPFADYTEIRLESPGTAWSKTQAKLIVDAVSEAVGSYILHVEEEGILRRLIAGEHGYDQAEEQKTVLEYCRQVLEKDDFQTDSAVPVVSKREQRLIKQLRGFLHDYGTVNVQGFLRFRAVEYRKDLAEVVEFAIDEYLMDKQYQEFISLLKYFVYIQESKIPAAHLMHKGGHEFVLLNDKMKPIDTSNLDSTFTVELLDKEINFEDLIVSTLITVAPEQIHIHTREPELQVIKTIMQIFEGRSTLCSYCKTCKPVLGEPKQQDHQFYP